jgi:hypothetical protein
MTDRGLGGTTSFAVQIDLNDSTNGAGTPVTAEPGAAWQAIPELATPGTLPGAWQDGYWRTGNVVHILTRHLSLFAILTGIVSDASAPPRAFAAVIADDGLTLRWAPGIPRVRTFVLYADGRAIAQFGGEEFEAKLGQIAPTDTRRFTLTEINPLGVESAHTPVPARGTAVATISVSAARSARLHGRPDVRVSAASRPARRRPDRRARPGRGAQSTSGLQRRAPAARSPSRSRSPRARVSGPLACRARVDHRPRGRLTLDAKPYRRVQRRSARRAGRRPTLKPPTLPAHRMTCTGRGPRRDEGRGAEDRRSASPPDGSHARNVVSIADSGRPGVTKGQARQPPDTGPGVPFTRRITTCALLSWWTCTVPPSRDLHLVFQSATVVHLGPPGAPR